MGRLLLVYRLAIRDLRRRPVEALLLLLTITAATTTLALGLVLHGTSTDPWSRTAAATGSPDIVAQTYPTVPGAQADLTALETAPGVVGSSGPYPLANPVLRVRGIVDSVFAEGRDETLPAIDRPDVTDGSWVRPGGVVVERAFAEALSVQPGDTITLDNRSFQVVGEAVTTAHGANWRPQLVWLTRSDAQALGSAQNPLAYVLNLRLSNPAAAPAFAAAHSPAGLFVASWQDIQGSDEKEVSVVQIVLLVGTWLLGMLAVASVAVLVGGRMVEQTRRAGLLKAVGATPWMVAVVMLAENLVLALASTVIGLVAALLTAPKLAVPSDSLLGSATPPAVTLSTVLLVLLLAVAVAGMATGLPAIRAARSSTIWVLNDPAHPPRRRPLLIKLSARLPIPLLLGLRLAARRPRRTILTAISLTITDAMIVTALVLHSTFTAAGNSTAAREVIQTGLGNPLLDRVSEVVFMITVVLVVLASTNAVFITQATVLDAQRPSALARAFGATPRQVSTGLTTAQLIPTLFAGLLSVPIGLGIFQLASGQAGSSGGTVPPTAWLVALVAGTVVVIAALTFVPARAGARRPVAEVLRSE
jgi:putative ABC transport system permease protein